MYRYVSAIAAVSLLYGAPGNTEAAGNVDITVVVPEVCQIESTAITVDSNGSSASGTVFEMCNSGRGFRVIASHRTLAGGEEVEINYNGQVRELDSSGVSDVAFRNGPIAGSVPVTIQSNGLVEGISISLGLTII
ncbi:hypothetical protein [Henriciella sp.]|uniref:hypothetical protein n=1 Tax=Henriciella sp. TaxID=1968823 RepID=UPI00261C1120|nr:hypothetical protein [Henriciella sp.]